MRMPRRPLLRGCRFSFVVSLNEKIMRVGRQIPDMAHIFQGSFQIKKHRLIVWIHRVKRLTRWYEPINFRGGLFYLLPVSQNQRGKRITGCANDEPNSDKRHDYLGPSPIVPRRHPLGPLKCIFDIAHRQ